ncbi:nocturnin-like [Ptychodera flava]|uniref:nocturnin-like n=1 Tax=Ptychodera flava TaxID=63121 RepID=UPI00396A94CB
MGQTNTATRMASNALLAQCRESLNGFPPLLTRNVRRVKHIGNPSASVAKGPNIRVLQWNVLADALCQNKDNFIKAHPDGLLWENRKSRSLEEILTYDPDIICLEEVDHYHDFYNPMLQSVGYQGIFKPKPDSPCVYCVDHNGPDGCALFYKSDKFDVVDGITPNLKVTMPGEGSWTTNQVAIIYTLQGKPPSFKGEQFIVGVTHLKAKKGWDDLRHVQGLKILEHLQEQAKNKAVIFCGDFNAETSEKVYGAFKESDLGLDSAYKLLSEDGSEEPPYTTWKIRPSGEMKHTIDYMWYSKEKLNVHAVLELPTESQLGDGRAPSLVTASDHFSMVCDFKFKPDYSGDAAFSSL